MRVAVGCDHRGVHAKARLKQILEQSGHAVCDEGTHNCDSVDYPDYAALVAGKVSSGEIDRGILICGTGIGMCITANKFPGVRAAACHDEITAELSRRHNDTNVLCLSGDALSDSLMDRVVKLWMETPFEGGRHARRVERIAEIEQQLSVQSASQSRLRSTSGDEDAAQ